MFLQISGKWKTTSGKMEDREPAQLKDELSGLKMRALQQKAEEVGVAQDQTDEADDSKEDLIDLILDKSKSIKPNISLDSTSQEHERHIPPLLLNSWDLPSKSVTECYHTSRV